VAVKVFITIYFTNITSVIILVLIRSKSRDKEIVKTVIPFYLVEKRKLIIRSSLTSIFFNKVGLGRAGFNYGSCRGCGFRSVVRISLPIFNVLNFQSIQGL
jgi:hypothetical protein